MKYLFSAILVICTAIPVFSTPIQWPTSEGGNGSYYEAVAAYGILWDAARTEAESMVWEGFPGHLATLTSAAEHDWVWEALGHPDSYWLGGYQLEGAPEPDGGWMWVTLELWDYTNWNAGEPNNGGSYGNESALAYAASGGKWNDAAPIRPDLPGYIVEFTPPPIPVEAITWGRVKAVFER